MAKLLLPFLFIFFLVDSYSQQSSDTLYTKGNVNDENYKAVFIKSKNSEFHKQLFKNLWDSESYQYNLKHLVEVTAVQKHASPAQYISNWISIYTYKGRNVGYYPSEPFYNLYIKVTDSTIIMNDFNDGIVPYAIRNIIHKKDQLIFQIIDSNSKQYDVVFNCKKDSVVEVSSSLFNRQKIRMMKQEDFCELPIIVNYCPNSRCNEFEFENN